MLPVVFFCFTHSQFGRRTLQTQRASCQREKSVFHQGRGKSPLNTQCTFFQTDQCEAVTDSSRAISDVFSGNSRGNSSDGNLCPHRIRCRTPESASRVGNSAYPSENLSHFFNEYRASFLGRGHLPHSSSPNGFSEASPDAQRFHTPLPDPFPKRGCRSLFHSELASHPGAFNVENLQLLNGNMSGGNLHVLSRFSHSRRAFFRSL